MKIFGKPGKIALNGLIEVLCLDAIKRGQITIQHHPLASDEQDRPLDVLCGNPLCQPRIVHWHASGEKQ